MKRLHVATGAALVVAALAVAPPPARAGRPAGQASSAASGQAAPTAESLDLMLAPIALYPDQLLAQILLCAGTPGKVGELSAWLKQNPSLKGTELQQAAEKAGFEPSFVALALFPQTVELMAGDLRWTQRLGNAFAADKSAVFASIQRLRKQSQEVGNLKSSPQQTVETKTTDSGQQVIVIEPANPQVVYVPQYNAQTIYTQAAPTTVVVQENNTGAAVAAGAIGFAAGIAIGAAFDNDYYYGPYGWRGGAYMYNDGWDDWYDDREDAREDWYENREDAREDWQENRSDMASERSERASTSQQQRTERQQTAQSPEAQAQRDQRRTEAQGAAQKASTPEAQAQREQRRTDAQGTAQQARSSGAQVSGQQARATGTSNVQSRSGSTRAAGERSGTRSDAFSGYSSGRSTRAASSRGQTSRSSSGGGRSRRR
jgi:hypothetical protein